MFNKKANDTAGLKWPPEKGNATKSPAIKLEEIYNYSLVEQIPNTNIVIPINSQINTFIYYYFNSYYLDT